MTKTCWGYKPWPWYVKDIIHDCDMLIEDINHDMMYESNQIRIKSGQWSISAISNDSGEQSPFHFLLHLLWYVCQLVS